MKHFACRSLGNDCDFEVHAEAVEDMMQRIVDHLHEVHQLKLMRDDGYQEAQIRAACAEELLETPYT